MADIMQNKKRFRSKSVPDTEAEKRRDLIVIAASRLFARDGYDATSMRDIAEVSGILAGSIYHHFSSKAELFIAAHEAGVATQQKAVIAALKGLTDPWDRLSAAAAAHCMVLLEGEPAVFSTPGVPTAMTSHRAKLIRDRDAYEKIFEGLVTALPLSLGTDRHLFRLHFLGALNWVPQWYRGGGRLSPEEIGRGLVSMLRVGGVMRLEPESRALKRPSPKPATVSRSCRG
jgi:TetR/AcrR family transcriptional regulator, cholesterol catabolism regulator